MRLNHSCIFKENLNITFTYKDRNENCLEKKSSIFQSVIFQAPNHSRGALAQVTKSIECDFNSRHKNILAQSMYQQNCPLLMNQSFCQTNNSVGKEGVGGLAKLAQLRPRQIEQEKYQASIQDFQVGQLLGKGAMGNVYVCRHKQTGFFFALKKMKKKTVTDISQFIESIKIQLFLNQPNIVKLYAVFDDPEHIYLLLQLCADGNLKSQAKSIRNSKNIQKYMLGIAYGLRHLHRRNIRHGDIKLQNILCCYGIPKIGDFDCISCDKYKNTIKKRNTKILGSPLYFSPEMMKQSILGLNDDVWSLGIICYELLCGYYPFEISSPTDLFNIIRQEIKQFPAQTDPFLQQLTRNMLCKRVCQRPKLSAIIKQLERD